MLERELELIGAGALGGMLKRKARHAHQPGTPCANCQTELQGPYCHVCGQPSDDQHRSILHLMWEGIEGLTHLDGRLGQTLPPLFLAPGKLARDHFEGRRQRHVPPFRLFLISLLVFMFVLESLFHSGATEHKSAKAPAGSNPPVAASGQTAGKDITEEDAGDKDTDGSVTVIRPGKGPAIQFNAGRPTNGKLMTVGVNGKTVGVDDDDALKAALNDPKDKDDKLGGWLKPRLKRAIENKEFYGMVLFTWAHRLAILLLPILAGLLALVYVRRRKFYIYDHLIVSMQFLSFVFLISALAWIMPDAVRLWTVLAASFWAPINLFQTLRGAYGSKWYTAAAKTVFLWTSTLFLFSVLMVGLMTLALAEMA